MTEPDGPSLKANETKLLAHFSSVKRLFQEGSITVAAKEVCSLVEQALQYIRGRDLPLLGADLQERVRREEEELLPPRRGGSRGLTFGQLVLALERAGFFSAWDVAHGHGVLTRVHWRTVTDIRNKLQHDHVDIDRDMVSILIGAAEDLLRACGLLGGPTPKLGTGGDATPAESERSSRPTQTVPAGRESDSGPTQSADEGAATATVLRLVAPPATTSAEDVAIESARRRSRAKKIEVELSPQARELLELGFRALPSRPRPFRPHARQKEEAERLGLPIALDHLATGVKLAFIPSGEFTMGADSMEAFATANRPPHSVKVEAFYLGVTPVTVGQWQTKLPVPSGRPRDLRAPACGVAWETAREFLRLMGPKTRLPSEAEWEYAARALSNHRFWWGPTFRSKKVAPEEERVNDWGGFLLEDPIPGSFPAYVRPAAYYEALVSRQWWCWGRNPFGLSGLLGNVGEWVEDRWHDTYSGAPCDGSPWEEGDSPFRVFRGGTRMSALEDDPFSLTKRRHSGMIQDPSYPIGFRCVLSLPL